MLFAFWWSYANMWGSLGDWQKKNEGKADRLVRENCIPEKLNIRIMHKNYASLVQLVVSDKYLIFYHPRSINERILILRFILMLVAWKLRHYLLKTHSINKNIQFYYHM